MKLKIIFSRKILTITIFFDLFNNKNYFIYNKIKLINQINKSFYGYLT